MCEGFVQVLRASDMNGLKVQDFLTVQLRNTECQEVSSQRCSALDCGERDGRHAHARVCFPSEGRVGEDLRNSEGASCVQMGIDSR